jgi:hypothetical protein
MKREGELRREICTVDYSEDDEEFFNEGWELDRKTMRNNKEFDLPPGTPRARV